MLWTSCPRNGAETRSFICTFFMSENFSDSIYDCFDRNTWTSITTCLQHEPETTMSRTPSKTSKILLVFPRLASWMRQPSIKWKSRVVECQMLAWEVVLSDITLLEASGIRNVWRTISASIQQVCRSLPKRRCSRKLWSSGPMFQGSLSQKRPGKALLISKSSEFATT